jgi:hypothetical protein
MVYPTLLAAAAELAPPQHRPRSLAIYRFWRDTHDRLFAHFGTAFWLLAVSWTLLALVPAGHESRPFIYVVRLVAFVLIISGIVDKNRARGH